jgi:two-component system sensor histidine kinase UhpB
LRSLARQLAEVQEAERKELARELHDQVGQNLAALDFRLNMIRDELAGKTTSPDSAQTHLEGCVGLLHQTAERVRNVMVDLRPPVLDDYGLLAALRWYGEQRLGPLGIAMSLEGTEPEPRLASAIELTLFRICQEALTNVIKHARARSVTVTMDTEPQTVRVTVADDGTGFDPESRSKLGPRTSWGLLTMAERAASVGGRCAVESRPGGGTRVIVEVSR